MKLIIAIVQDEDSSRLIGQLMNDGFGVTKLATTGGFLRAGNATLLVGVEDDRFQEAMDLIEKVCKSRKQIAPSPASMVGMPGSYTALCHRSGGRRRDHFRAHGGSVREAVRRRKKLGTDTTGGGAAGLYGLRPPERQL